VLVLQSREAIRESIVNPAAVIAEGFPPIMPATFAETMMVKELEMVVDFLLASKANEPQEAAAIEETPPEDNASKISKETEKEGE